MSSEFIKPMNPLLAPERYAPLRLVPLMPHFGARIEGLDLTKDQPEEIKRTLREAFLRFGVLFFPNQKPVSPEQQIQLASIFGDPDPGSPFIPKIADGVDILITDRENPPYANLWHSDNTGLPHSSFGTLIQIQECPPVGGNTSWSSTRMSYSCLSDEMKTYLEKLQAYHYWDNRGQNDRSPDGLRFDNDFFETYFKRLKEMPPQIHPVVRRHPITGEPAIYVNETFTKAILGRHIYESKSTLEFLFAWNHIPEFHLVHHWQKNDIAVWDNFSMQHYALGDYTAYRVNQRVEFELGKSLDYGFSKNNESKSVLA